MALSRGRSSATPVSTRPHGVGASSQAKGGAASRPAERCLPHQPPCGRARAPRFCRWGRGEPVSGCRCARGRAHVAEQMWQRVSPVPVQMWYGPDPRSRFLRGRCGLAAVGPQLAELGSGLERVLCCGCWHSRADPKKSVGAACSVRPMRKKKFGCVTVESTYDRVAQRAVR